MIKLGLAVAKVPTNRNISSASMYQSYIHESWSKKDCTIILSCGLDIVKSCSIYCFDQYRGKQSWDTHMEHTSRYTQSVNQKGLLKILRY